MGIITKTRTVEYLRNLFGLQIGVNPVPNGSANFIQPVVDATPDCDIVKRGEAINNTAGTIWTTPTDKDFYLCAAQLSLCKDVTATSTNSSLRVTIGGVAVQLLTIVGITLTVQNDSIAITLPRPIKVDRGTAITVNNATNVANIIAAGTITGYLI